MHICFLTPEFPSKEQPEGGLGNYLRKISKQFVQKGHNVTIFLLSNTNRRMEVNGIRIIPIKKTEIKPISFLPSKIFKIVNLNLINKFINIKRIKNIVLRYHKEHPIDVLQTSNFQFLGLKLCDNKKFPIICRISSYGPLLRAASGKPLGFPDAINDWLEAYQVTHSDDVICPSEFIANTYQRFLGVSASVLRTPLDQNKMVHDESVFRSLDLQNKYLLYFGSLNGVKGVDILIHAAKRILQKYETVSFIFIGRNDLMPNGIHGLTFIKQIFRNYYNDRVHYFEPLPKNQLFPFIKYAYGVILPSRVDNYPNACLEAISFGIPVVGTKNSSLDEMIKEGITGYLAENSDVCSLIEAISKLLDQSPEQHKTMRAKIKNYSREINSKDHISELLAVYETNIQKFRNK